MIPSDTAVSMCDVLIIGSGAGGLAAATAAAAGGLDVVLAEREPLLGGTAARSGGWMWAPGNRGPAARGDTTEAVLAYLDSISQGRMDRERVDAFLDAAPEAVEFFENETDVHFEYPEAAPDYDMGAPGARRGGRAICAQPFDALQLGEHRLMLQPPLSEMTVLGVMPQLGNDLDNFVRANRSARAFGYVLRRVATNYAQRVRHRRGLTLSNGNALAGRLLKSAVDKGVQLWPSSTVEALEETDGRVSGALLIRDGVPHRVHARRGVVLASGGISHDVPTRQEVFPHDATRDNHFSAVTQGHDAANLRLTRALGGYLDTDVVQPAAWAPVTVFRGPRGRQRIYPHLRGIGLPGIIAVDRHGRRFTNESNSYHDFGQAMMAANRGDEGDYAFLICDARAMHRYGIGYAKPWPMPRARYRWNGYLTVAKTVDELTARTGIDAAGLRETLARYNPAAARGEDPEFGRGATEYNWFRGDREHRPNPSLAPVEKPPFYATRIHLGDLGAFVGLRTDGRARVLRRDGSAIAGLHAVGSAASSPFGGAYPGYGAMLGPGLVYGHVVAQELLAGGDG